MILSPKKMPLWLPALVVLASLLRVGVEAFVHHHRKIDNKLSLSFPCRFSAPTSTDVSIPPSPNQEDDNNDEEWKEESQRLSHERNLPLEHVLNGRDLASCKNSPIQPGRVFRTGRLSEADHDDIHLLMDDLHLKTLVDLRSPTELKDDERLMRQDVFGNFTTVVWSDRGRKKEGCVQVLPAEEFPVKERFWKRHDRHKTTKTQNMVDNAILGTERYDISSMDSHEDEDEEEGDCACCEDDEEDCGVVMAASEFHANREARQNRRERMFVSLMNEFKYVKGTVSKLRKRDILRTLLKSPGTIFSRRARSSIKKPFLKEINIGGLQLLNELLFQYGAPGIKFVLEVCADTSRHPVAFYCTAGKDRTGAIAAIILALCGVDLEDIVEDYSLSANVYAEMGDHQAMVGALSQRSLDPEVFLGAPPQVMRDTLLAIQERYGSVESYCDWIGFGSEKQRKLRDALLK